MAYMRLGDLLVSAGVIRPEQLNEALAIQKKSRERLGDVLINNGIITEQQLIEALQMQLGVDFVDLTAVSIPLELARFVPRSIAKKYCVVPVKLQKDELYVAMSDPLNFEAQEEIKSASHKQVVPMIATRRAVEQAIATLYGNEGTARAIEEMKREAGSNQADIVPVQMSKAVDNGAAEAPTIRFVNSVIERAITPGGGDGGADAHRRRAAPGLYRPRQFAGNGHRPIENYGRHEHCRAEDPPGRPGHGHRQG